MDRTGIIAVAICLALLGYWFVQTEKQNAQRQEQLRQFALTNPAVATTTVTNPETVSTTTTTIVPASLFDTNVPEQRIVLTNAEARYTFTSRGGGLALVELLNYPETISARWTKRKSSSTNEVASLNTRADVPMLAVLGDTNLVGDGNFTLSEHNGIVRAEKLLPDGLRLVKEFSLSSNYLVNASVSFENTSEKSIALPAQELVTGTASPMDPDDTTFYIYGGAMWFNGTNLQTTTESYFKTNTTTFFGIIPRTPTPEFRAGENNVVWAAAYNQFFAMLAMPKQPAEEVVARPVTLPPFPDVEQVPGMPLPRGIQTALVYPAQTLATNSSIERQIIFYAGPKEYRTLAQIGDEFQNHADLAMNFGSGYISFWGVGTFFAKLLLAAMNGLHDMTKLGYGVLIVVLTVILRVMFWPLTAMSLKSAKRMQALAPELKVLKEKYKDDAQKFTKKQWELFRKNKVNPMSGCLPMLLQMPVFLGFFTMIRSSIELRGAHFLWVADLTKPDTVFMIPGLNFPFNLLPLLMVGVMVWQTHLQPPSPGMDPSQQKMMRYFPLMLLLFLYNYSSGMALYMTVSTLMGVLQSKVLRTVQKPAAATTPVITSAPKKKK